MDVILLCDALNLDRCSICSERLALPCRLRTSCNCRAFFCLNCTREMLARHHEQCPNCRSPVHYTGVCQVMSDKVPMGCKYDWQISLWQLNDLLPPEQQFLRSECSKCDSQFTSQRALHQHLNNDCRESTVNCQFCRYRLKRRELQEHLRLCWAIPRCNFCKMPQSSQDDSTCVHCMEQRTFIKNEGEQRRLVDLEEILIREGHRKSLEWGTRLIKSKCRTGVSFTQVCKSAL